MKRLGADRRSLLRKVLALIPFACVISSVQLHAAPIAVGVIDEVNRIEGTIKVLGQTFPLAGTRIVKETEVRANAHQLLSGQLVWIDVESSPNGPAYSVYVLTEDYAEGSTEVFIAGRVSAVTSTGTFRVGALAVDFNAALSRESVAVSAGDWIELFGVQPARNGLFLADRANIGRSVGSGKLGVGGSGTLGVGGSGTLGVGGSGTLGVGGSGTS